MVTVPELYKWLEEWKEIFHDGPEEREFMEKHGWERLNQCEGHERSWQKQDMKFDPVASKWYVTPMDRYPSWRPIYSCGTSTYWITLPELPKPKTLSPTTIQVEEKTSSAVNHPSHYNMGKFEVIDVIEDWKLGFNLGNVIKYVARAEHKGKQLEDLKKAAFYLNREIEKIEKEVKQNE